MADPTDAELEAASALGDRLWETEARAQSAHYDRETGRLIVQLRNDGIFSVPARHLQGLEQATEDEIAEVEVVALGYGLHWQALDEDHAVPALVAGIFGTRTYMAQFAERRSAPGMMDRRRKAVS